MPAVAFASPDERRTAEVEWFVAKPGRGGYGVAKGERDGAIFFAESTVRDEGVPASGRKITYKVEANEPLVSVGGEDHVRAVDVEVLPQRKPPSPRNRPPLNTRERIRGTCTWFSDQCKYGYLRPDDASKPDVFVHAAALTDLGGSLRTGDRCELRVATYNGRQRAVNVVGVDGFTGNYGPANVPQTAPARSSPSEPFFSRPVMQDYPPPTGYPGRGADYAGEWQPQPRALSPLSGPRPPFRGPAGDRNFGRVAQGPGDRNSGQPRAAEWPGGMEALPRGVSRVTPRNYPLFDSQDPREEKRGGVDWRA